VSSTPAPHPKACPPRHACIHLLRPLGDDFESARALLNDGEIERVARFRFARDAGDWISWRAGLRQVLGSYLDMAPSAVPIRTDPAGKPRLAKPHQGLHFNLSHSPNLAAVIVSGDGPVGIDLEPLDRAASLPECRDEFCHPDEIARLPEDPPALGRALLEIWVAKEALLKALGTGLGFPPRQLQIVGDQGHSEPGLPGLPALKLATPLNPSGHLLAVAVPLTVQTFDLIDR